MVVLVRYGELALKSPYVRRQLEDRLLTNVQEMFAANGQTCIVRRERGRLFVHADDEAAAVRLLRRVFGIVSVSPAVETSADLPVLTEAVTAFAKGILEPHTSFAIRARRSGEHPYTSQDLGRVLGRAVQEAVSDLTVDLDTPDRELHVEVRGNRAYVFHEIVDGPGGLPLGTQGDVSATVDAPAGMVAAWLVMRRGCRVLVRGSGTPVDALRAWDPHLRVANEGEVDGTSAREAAVTATIDLEAIDPEEGRLALTPLVGLTPAEIEALARKIEDA